MIFLQERESNKFLITCYKNERQKYKDNVNKEIIPEKNHVVSFYFEKKIMDKLLKTILKLTTKTLCSHIPCLKQKEMQNLSENHISKTY